MKRYLSFVLLVASVACLTGCNITRISRTDADGNKFTATNARAIWQSKGIDVTYSRKGDELNAAAKIDASGSDAELVKAATEGAVSALLKAQTGQ